jgi:hypothetical protein
MAEGMGIQTLVATKGAWRPFSGWEMTLQCMEHSLVGSITTGVTTLTALTCNEQLLRPMSLPLVVSRYATMVLSVKPYVNTFRTAPSPVGGDELLCVNLVTYEHPYYHGGGFLTAASFGPHTFHSILETARS